MFYILNHSKIQIKLISKGKYVTYSFFIMFHVKYLFIYIYKNSYLLYIYD